jgi:transcriptional regulator with XRE-family HTH domain
MIERTTVERSQAHPVQRLIELLDRLASQGMTQREVASRINVPSQYLSDLRHNRRPLTELFARRFGHEFGVNYEWLLGRAASPERPTLAMVNRPTSSVWLPAFPHPVEGDPQSHPKWDGTFVEVSGAAVAKSALALQPYVLRFDHDDRQGRLKKGDLILCSQAPCETAEFHIVQCRTKCFLARRIKGKWVRVATGGELQGKCEIAGHCLGVVWGPLA